MTYDPTRPYKNVDGKNVNLTDAEIAEWQAQKAAYVPPPAPPVEPLSDLINTLIANGVITADQLQASTVTSVNQSLEAAKLSPIAVSAQPAKIS